MRIIRSIYIFAALVQGTHGFCNFHVGSLRSQTTTSTFATEDGVVDEAEALSKPTEDEVVDDAEGFSKSAFPIAPDDLIARTKEFFGPEISAGTKDGGASLADDFEFCAAVVGPISKDEYLNALGTFKLEDSFEIQQNMFGFTVDPTQPNRVWFFDRQTAKHVNTFNGVEATGKELVLPPQVFHLDFNEDGKVKEVGFYTADRQQGNTGGLGGAFGYFYGLGRPLPIPEAKPFKPSFRYRMLMKLGSLAKKFQKKKDD